ncbi:alpha/beta hydrolase [Nocardioides sp. Bht2]|uniref:alpha/beta hydrolase n=1 Tax=Nocardioides sp. Bht2 TaxID=3392297 RepID=UPI0039B6503D
MTTSTQQEQSATITERFTSGGVTCHATHVPARSDALTTAAGRPVVVLAHGLAGTVDSGLLPFAEGFADAGLDAFAFDYRGFGASEGSPRQRVRIEDQVADLHAAIDAARALPGVDPDRVALWGVSLAGGHVIRVAAERDDVAAVVAVVPMVDGLAAAAQAAKTHRPTELLRATGRGVRGRIAGRLGLGEVTMPVVAAPGKLGALTLPGAEEDYLAIAGPTWRNVVHADVGLELGGRKPLQLAGQVTAPLLVQIADFDRSAPPQAAANAAFAAKAQVRHYPCDHFDIFAPKPWHGAALQHATSFLSRALAR